MRILTAFERVAIWHTAVWDDSEVGQAIKGFQTAHPGAWVDIPMGSHPQLVKDLFSGLHDMMTKYPHVPVKSVGTTYHGKQIKDTVGFSGQTAPDPYLGTPLGSAIGFRPDFLTDSERAQKFQDAKAHPGISNLVRTDYPLAYQGAVHEFAHALDAVGGNRAQAVVDEALRQHAEDLHPEWKTKEWATQQRLVEGYDYAPRYLKTLAYDKWLHEQLPHYAFGNGGAYGHIHRPEALAEGFTDAELNGDRASDASKFLHQLLLDQSKGDSTVKPPYLLPEVTQ